MELLPIIYRSLFIFTFFLIVVLFISYGSYIIKKRKRNTRATNKRKTAQKPQISLQATNNNYSLITKSRIIKKDNKIVLTPKEKHRFKTEIKTNNNHTKPYYSRPERTLKKRTRLTVINEIETTDLSAFGTNNSQFDFTTDYLNCYEDTKQENLVKVG